MYLIHQLVQRSLLVHATVQNQQHSFHWQIRRCCALIEAPDRQRMNIFLQGLKLSFINRLPDTPLACRLA